MSAVPADIDTDRGPPTRVPMAHFLVGFTFLLAGSAAALASQTVGLPGLSGVATVHLLAVGWVMVTVMGAMTQFVPVWTGVSLHARGLAWVGLGLVVVGLVGFVAALSAGALSALPWAGLVVLAGFWTFAYDLGRTLLRARPLDVTERHFLLALCALVVLTTLGVGLAASYAGVGLPVAHGDLRAAHATLAVFGVVLMTALGALYQLATMFTATELHGVDGPLKRVESVLYPVGVAVLAGGRLVGSAPAVRVGGVLLATGVFAFAVVLARKLAESEADTTPMRTRYAVAAFSLLCWAPLAGAGWASAPTPAGAVYGPGPAGYLLFAAVGFVLLGTLYHVVPFLVWVERYADRLGLERVPMVDDLYDDRLARGGLCLALAGLLALLAGRLSGHEGAVLAAVALFGLRAALFVADMAGVLARHGDARVFSPLGVARE